jgi:hypothetical protein
MKAVWKKVTAMSVLFARSRRSVLMILFALILVDPSVWGNDRFLQCWATRWRYRRCSR